MINQSARPSVRNNTIQMAFWDTPRHFQKQIPRCVIAHQPEPVLAYVLSALRVGKGVLKVAAECGVGSGTVHRIKREMEANGPFESAEAA